MILDALLGGGSGYSSSPSQTGGSPPAATTQPAATTPAPATPAGDAPSDTPEPADGDAAEDDVPMDINDGTYFPAPVAADDPSADTDIRDPLEVPAATQPDAAEAEPDAYDPSDGDDAEADGHLPQPPAVTIPSLPRPPAVVLPLPVSQPAGSPVGSLLGGITEQAMTPAAAVDPVARITNLIASYEEMLSQPPADDMEEDRTRAMELAQNRVLTSLIDSMSTADARMTLLDDGGDPSDQVSLINQYYAESGR